MTIDQERQKQAAAYARASYLVLAVNLMASGVYVLAWLLSGLSRKLTTGLMARALARPARVALYLTLFGLGYAVITFPLDYLAHRLSRSYRISVQSDRAWLADLVKAGLLSLGFGLIVGEVCYTLLAIAPDTWWLWAGAFLFLVTVVLAHLFPVFIVPLFFRMTALKDQELAERLTRLAGRAGTRVRGVFTLDFSRKTTAANAALMGWGNTRRIVLADTLLQHYTPDEIEVILGHELAHQVHGDTWKGMLFGGALLWSGLWVAGRFLAWAVERWNFGGIDDIAAFPLLAMCAGGFALAATPLNNAYSRWREKLADEYALRITGNTPAFLSAMAKLANQNLAEVQPPRWAVWLLHDHPPIGERLRLGKSLHGTELEEGSRKSHASCK
jgi:STE24 endopeptidase